MSTQKILIGGIIGGALALLFGFVAYGLILGDFFQKNMGSATGVMRADDEMLWIPMILGHLSWGLLLAFIFGQWASISTPGGGLRGGAIIGFLVSFTNNMIQLGTTHIVNSTAAIVDIVVITVISALVGAAIGAFFGRGRP